MRGCPNVLPNAECVDPDCTYCRIASAEGAPVKRVLIPHDNKLAPGSWFLSAGQPVHRCPECLRAAAMVLHSVDADGEVNASIACVSPCGYHVWGKLDGWTHGVKKAGDPVAC